MKWSALLALILGSLATPLTCTPAAAAPTAAPTAGAAAIVRATGGLNVRAGAATDRAVSATLKDGSTVRVVCQVYGELVKGSRRTNALWDRISVGHGHVADAFLEWAGGRPPLPWCGDPPTDATTPSVTLTSGTLNIRSGPGTGYRRIGELADRTALTVICRSWGTTVDGNAVWDQVAPGKYVSDAFVRWAPERPRYPWCGQQPPSVPAASRPAFFARVAPAAQASMRTYKVPASVTLAQAVLESGWGRSTLTRLDHSYFGMKCFGSPGPIAVGCSSYATHECSGSRCYATRADFRAYRSMADSFADHGQQLATLPRYQTAMRYAADPERFAREIHKAGYATSPAYADSLIKLIRQYGLTKYDKLP